MVWSFPDVRVIPPIRVVPYRCIHGAQCAAVITKSGRINVPPQHVKNAKYGYSPGDAAFPPIIDGDTIPPPSSSPLLNRSNNVVFFNARIFVRFWSTDDANDDDDDDDDDCSFS